MSKKDNPCDSVMLKHSSNGSEELESIYRQRFGAFRDYRQRVWKTLVERFFSRYVSRDAAVLDLGCGRGEFINNIQCRKKFAMDINPDTRHYLNSDVTFLEQDGSLRWNLSDDALDVVFTSNFFEHAPSKQVLSEIIAQTRRCIRPGGRLIAIGPNIRFVGNAYWDFCDHHVPLTDSSMAELLEVHGFRIERAVDRFLPYTMVRKRPVPNSFVVLYLSLPPVWKILGKQFLIIARKS
jgi:SAM-dependent methyltransferase